MNLRNKIIEELYNSKEVADAISKMEPSELREDLKQECFMVLLELPEERFNKIQSDGGLKFFFVRTMLNMIRSSTSAFYRKFRNYEEFNKEITEIAESEHIDATAHLDTLHWYEKELFMLYIKMDCSVKKVADFTKIPYMSVYKTINMVKKTLKKRVRKNI